MEFSNQIKSFLNIKKRKINLHVIGDEKREKRKKRKKDILKFLIFIVLIEVIIIIVIIIIMITVDNSFYTVQ